MVFADGQRFWKIQIKKVGKHSSQAKDPKAKVPGTKMAYAGLKDEQKINDLVAFLKQFDADGKKK